MSPKSSNPKVETMDEQARLGKKQTTPTVSINGSFIFKTSLLGRDQLDAIYEDFFKLAKTYEAEGVTIEQFNINYHNYNHWDEMFDDGEVEKEETVPISGVVSEILDVEDKD